jgi:transcription initiation factor TFIIH subunit 2
MEEALAARRAVQNAQAQASVRRGMIRYVVLVVDCSSAMDVSNDAAFQPDRWSVVVAKVTDFLREFLKQNPLSYVQLVSMQTAKAIRLTDFSGIETAHCYALAALKPNGEASLQIALAEACASLRLAPSYSTREILIVHSTITTCDPNDIFTTIAAARKLRVRVSVVSISCEVFIFRHVTEETRGDFHVCRDAQDLIETLRRYITPLETLEDEDGDGGSGSESQNAAFVQMGFPTQKKDVHHSLCITTQTFEQEGYDCPRCKTKVHQLPVRCPVCSLALVLSSHLARSYHHLSPLQDFEHPTDGATGEREAVPVDQLCYACKQPQPPSAREEAAAAAAGLVAGASAEDTADMMDDLGIRRSNNGSGGNGGGSAGGSSGGAAAATGRRGGGGGGGEEEDEEDDEVGGGSAAELRAAAELDSAGDRFFQCPLCLNLFCSECNDFIHYSLHNCPGCL